MATMHKYGGTLIHRSHDPHGLLEVVEDGFSRSLHFGSEPKQSSMELHNPLHLTLAYTRAMMAALLFHPQPAHILLIGLGGGSLAKFLLHHFPLCHIDAVEQREAVYRLARGYFQLPDDPRLCVHIADAADFLALPPSPPASYDLILLDAFTADGIADSTCGLSFFDACRLRLAADGVLATNLWAADHIALDAILHHLENVFADRVLRLPVNGKANLVTLATRTGNPRQVLRRLDERAHRLQAQLALEFPNFLKALRKNNRRWF